MPLPIQRRTPSRAPTKTVSAGLSGAAALRAADEEERKQQARRENGRLPFRFWLPKGEGKGIILLDDWFIAEDDETSGAVLITEHDLEDPQNQNKRTLREICLASVGQPCPYCQAGERASRRFVLTVYEVSEWTHKTTGVVHPGSRRLLAFPVGMRSTFLQLQTAAQRGGHTMRGMFLFMQRGTDDKSASVGEPVMLDNNQLFEMLDWEQVEADYGNDPIMSTTQPGKVVKPANEDLTPIDYAKAFAVPVIEEMSAAPRGGVPRALPGSRQEQAQALAEEEDEIPMEHDTDPEPPAAPARARVPMRQAAPAPVAAPARARTPAAAAPASRPGAAPAARPAARQAANPPPAQGPARRRTASQPQSEPFE
jgi:hypothetical protein